MLVDLVRGLEQCRLPLVDLVAHARLGVIQVHPRRLVAATRSVAVRDRRLHHDGQGVRLDPDRQVADPSELLAVEIHVERRGQIRLPGRHARRSRSLDAARGCRAAAAGGRAPGRPTAGSRPRCRTSRRRGVPSARGPRCQATRAFITATVRPRHHDRRATRWATNQCRRPSSNAAPRSTAKVIASADRSRRSSPVPRACGTDRRLRARASGAGGRHAEPPRRALGPRRRCAPPRRRPATGLVCPTRRRARSSRGGLHDVVVDTFPFVASRGDSRRRRDDAAEQAVGRGPRRGCGSRVAARRRRSGAAGRCSCFMLRTKSPPESSSSARMSSSSSPAPHAWASAKNPGSGWRVSGSPAWPRRR